MSCYKDPDCTGCFVCHNFTLVSPLAKRNLPDPEDVDADLDLWINDMAAWVMVLESKGVLGEIHLNKLRDVCDELKHQLRERIKNDEATKT